MSGQGRLINTIHLDPNTHFIRLSNLWLSLIFKFTLN